MRSARYLAVVTALLCAAAGVPQPAAAHGGGARWAMGGHDLANSRSNPLERKIKPSNVADLAPAWTATTTGDVSATPAVVDGALYFPDWGGTFWKLDAASGRVIWSHKVSEYVGTDGAVSRTSPTVVGKTVYIGTQLGAQLLAIDTASGELRWKTQLDSHPAALLTQAPVVFDGVVYEGASSGEEISAIDPTYACCTFRGSLSAVQAATGRVLWKTSTIPEQTPGPGGPGDIFSGAGVLGGSPAIDPATHTVFVTTGNNYQVPKSVQECQTAGGTPAQCIPPWNHNNSIIAMDTRTGAIKWATGQDRWDVWNGGCIPGVPPNNCPPVPGPDFDFADGAHLFKLPGAHGHPRLAVGAGQKSGEYWMLDAATGEVIWSAAVGPGSFVGGIQYGSATDGRRIYFVETNAARQPYQLPGGQTIDYSSFGALDVVTGKVLWQIPEPTGAISAATVSTANGIVYLVSSPGIMYAYDGATGSKLWQFQGAASAIAGPAIVDGSVYWGNGYTRLGEGWTTSTTFYAFRRK